MRGSINWQVRQAFKTIIDIGSSKHNAKAKVRDQFSVNGTPATAANIAKRTNIYSYRTADLYRDISLYASQHARDEFGVKDIEKLTAEHIQAYLENKIDQGVAHATLLQYAAALEKFGVALNRYAMQKGSGRAYDFTRAIGIARDRGHQELKRHHTNRAYERPQELIVAMDKPDHQLAAQMQYEGGSRLREVNMIGEKHLHGLSIDPVTGRSVGVVSVKGKGGKLTDHMIAPDTYRRLEARIAKSPSGRYEINLSSYRAGIATAAAQTGQDHNGSHGLRYNFAQERYGQCIRAGMSHDEAITRVSHDMGHERPDITLHYTTA